MDLARWTLGWIALPARRQQHYLLLSSIESAVDAGLRIEILVNGGDPNAAVDCRDWFRDHLPADRARVGLAPAPGLGIAAARNLILSRVETRFHAQIDDDLRMSDALVLIELEQALGRYPLLALSLPVQDAETGLPLRPRPGKAQVPIGKGPLALARIEGHFFAGEAAAVLAAGGFATNRRFWGEWNEFCLRVHRRGYCTGYWLDPGRGLVHDSAAPGSATRSHPDRDVHLIYGALALFLEIALDARSSLARIETAVRVFWDDYVGRGQSVAGYTREDFFAAVVETRHAVVAGDAAPVSLWSPVRELLAADWEAIVSRARETERDPFPVIPFDLMPADLTALAGNFLDWTDGLSKDAILSPAVPFLPGWCQYTHKQR